MRQPKRVVAASFEQETAVVDPYPYPDSSHLLNLSFPDQQGRNGTMWHSLADYTEPQRASKTLKEIAARDGMNAVITSGLPESVSVVTFTPNAFHHFGIPVMIGRTWSPQDIPIEGFAADSRVELPVPDPALQC